jgi:fermentation-respiration switch protein FrsA (DUF1100 family)
VTAIARVRRVLVYVLAAGALLAITAYALRRPLTNAMLFYPVRGQDRTPEDLGLPYEEVWIRASDGVRTQAWWIPGRPDAAVVLFFHGNAGTIADRLENAAMLRALGPTVVLAEYRGYGDSEGKPSERGFEADALAALAEVRQRAPDRPVVVFGRSLGGAVATHVAATEAVDGLAVESAFTSLREVAGKALALPFAGALAAYDFDVAGKIGRVEAPVLVIHGEDDELVPVGMGRRLYERAGAAPWRRLHLVPDGDHNSTLSAGGPDYWQAWKDFLNAVMAPTKGSAPHDADVR